jgi:prolyl oligopeptidase
MNRSIGLRRALLLTALATGLARVDAAPAPAYPVTAKTEQVDTYFGTPVADPYRWLEDDNSAQTKAWVEAQNRTTFGVLDAIPFRAALRERIRAIANYPKYSAPQRRHGRVFFSKNDGLQNQSVLYMQDGIEGTPAVLLDPNTFSADGTVRLEDFKPSRDGRHAAYTKTAIPGSDWRDLYVIDLATGRTLPEVLHWVRFSGIAWRGDGFYYSRYPQPAKGAELTARAEHQSVWFHKVGTAQADDVLVHDDPGHPKRFNGVQTTEDERFAVLSSGEPGKRGNSLFVRDERQGEKAFRPIVAEIGEETFEVVDNVGAQLLVQTNRQAPNSRVMRVDPARPGFEHWVTVIAERAEPLARVGTAGGRLFASYLKDVTSRVEVFAPDGRPLGRIGLPGPGTASGFKGERGDGEVFYTFVSMNQPPSIYRYDIAEARSTLFRAPEIPGYDAARYESRQVFFKSRDGTRVPMFIVHRKGLKLDGRNPTILYGYGGFNVTLNPGFSATRIAWLEQGGVFAMANLRGGGEYGEAWHEAGMRLRKQNVFDDCIAAAEYLIAERYTAPDRLALQGGSNGGLLVGAVVNQRPELFRVALPQVGVMDMLRFQKFSVGAAWVSDYGSSDDETQFRYLLTYSPLHNIRAGVTYPATLVTTSDHDDRVVPAHSFKYVATLQEKAGTGAAPLLIRIATNSGHGSSNLGKALDEAADSYAFVWANMGITPVFGP